MEDLRVVEAHDRSVPVERVCFPNLLQDGVQPVSSQCHSERRLDGLHQLEECLPSSPSTSRQVSSSFALWWTGRSISFELFVSASPWPLLCDGRDGLSVLSSLFRPLHGPPQVFTRIMTPVSVMLHAMGVRILRYLDD